MDQNEEFLWKFILFTRLGIHIVDNNPRNFNRPLCLMFHLEEANKELGNRFTENQLSAIYRHLTSYLHYTALRQPHLRIPCITLLRMLVSQPERLTDFLENLTD